MKTESVRNCKKWNWISVQNVYSFLTPQNLRQLNCSFTTISSHFLAIFINIFHEKEVQTVILRCWTGLYVDWFMNYDTKRKYFHFRFLPILKKNRENVAIEFFCCDWIFSSFITEILFGFRKAYNQFKCRLKNKTFSELFSDKIFEYSCVRFFAHKT